MTQSISTILYGFSFAYPSCLQNISFKTKCVAGLILGAALFHRMGLTPWLLSLATRVTTWRSPPPRTASVSPKATALFYFLDHLGEYVTDKTQSLLSRLEYKKFREHINFKPSLNRLRHPRLQATEEALLKNIEANQPNKNAKLRYLSWGDRSNTDLLQDYINVGKLLRAGYKDLEITISDCADFVKADICSLQECAEELGATLQFVFPAGPLSQEKFNIIQVRTCVKFESIFPFFSFSHLGLTNPGHLYLRCEDWDLFFDNKGCTHSKFFQEESKTPILTDELAASLEKAAEQKNSAKELKVALLSEGFYLHQWIHLLPRLCKSPHLEQLHLTLLPPQRSKHIIGEVYEQKYINPQFSQPKHVAHFLSCICKKNVTVTYIDSPKQLGDSSNTQFFCDDFGTTDFDIILFLFNCDTEKNLKNRIEALTSTYRGSTLFFELTAENEFHKENDAIDDGDMEDKLFKLPPTPVPGSYVSDTDRNHYVLWQGTWRWDQVSGTTFIGNKADARDQATIRALMTSS